MATPSEEVQTLLRFLTQDAKVPLASAMGKVSELRKAKLGNAEALSRTSFPTIEGIFGNPQLAKQVFNAAKRVSNPKKRSAPAPASSPKGKRFKDGPQQSPAGQEKELKLPKAENDHDCSAMTVETNRAPLVLAFAVVLLSYTHPEQPLSSRLSLAQAVVSINSRSKAKSIGIESGPSAEDEGWGQGQPKIKVMGREIPVMRRSGYLAELEEEKHKTNSTNGDEPEMEPNMSINGKEEALWGIDLEAMRKSKTDPPRVGHLPIYLASSARSYLSRSFKLVEETSNSQSPSLHKQDDTDSQATIAASPPKPSDRKPKKQTTAEIAAEREKALALLLQSLDKLYQSWAPTLRRDELDRRAWQWYLHVRPDVKQGEAGWGQRGQVRLKDILDLRKDGT
ncbi:MAG: hypothetical protein Q9227_007625 [Pyrenula ochraceoflavens]